MFHRGKSRSARSDIQPAAGVDPWEVARVAGLAPRPASPASDAGAPQRSTVPAVRPRPREAPVHERVGAERFGDRNAFVTINDTIHFYPDRTRGAFGFLVLTAPSEARSPGVYLLDRARREWLLAYELDDLPRAQWVQATDWDGSMLPFQLFLLSEQVVAARWLNPAGASIPPGEWDVTGGPTPLELWAAQREHERIMDNIRRI